MANVIVSGFTDPTAANVEYADQEDGTWYATVGPPYDYEILYYLSRWELWQRGGKEDLLVALYSSFDDEDPTGAYIAQLPFAGDPVVVAWVAADRPKGPLGHPFNGPFGGIL